MHSENHANPFKKSHRFNHAQSHHSIAFLNPNFMISKCFSPILQYNKYFIRFLRLVNTGNFPYLCWESFLSPHTYSFFGFIYLLFIPTVSSFFAIFFLENILRIGSKYVNLHKTFFFPSQTSDKSFSFPISILQTLPKITFFLPCYFLTLFFIYFMFFLLIYHESQSLLFILAIVFF